MCEEAERQGSGQPAGNPPSLASGFLRHTGYPVARTELRISLRSSSGFPDRLPSRERSRVTYTHALEYCSQDVLRDDDRPYLNHIGLLEGLPLPGRRRC